MHTDAVASPVLQSFGPFGPMMDVCVVRGDEVWHLLADLFYALPLLYSSPS